MKRLILIALAGLVCGLSGCVVVPYGPRGYVRPVAVVAPVIAVRGYAYR